MVVPHTPVLVHDPKVPPDFLLRNSLHELPDVMPEVAVLVRLVLSGLEVLDEDYIWLLGR